jgi:hypothetical protein
VRWNKIPKLRCIDDFKVNGLNALTFVPETLNLPTFELPASIAAKVHKLVWLVLALDNMKMAYHKLGNAQADRLVV